MLLKFENSFYQNKVSKILDKFVQRIFYFREGEEDKPYHCFSDALLLGSEGSGEALQYLNDSAIVTEAELSKDSFLPTLSVGKFLFFF